MRVTRVHVPQALAAGERVLLEARAAQHLVRVLRLRAGDALQVFDGAGTEHAAEIVAVRGERVECRLGGRLAADAESPLAITLVQGVSRGERMDWTIQKATELGVARIVPVLAERSVVRLDDAQAARRLEHWRGVAVAACEQCGRARVPEIARPLRFVEHLAGLQAEDPGRPVRLVLAPDAGRAPRDLPNPLAAAELLVGPEGGLSDEELRLATARGYARLRLGPRILRTETAGPTAIAVLQALRGDLA